MKYLAPALLMCALLFACSKQQPMESQTISADTAHSTGSTTFDQDMLKISQDYFALRPETATYYGIPDSKAGEGTSSRLGSYSPAGEAARRAGLKAILDELAAIDATTLNDSQKISLQLVATEAGNAYKPATVVEYGSVLGEYGNWFIPYIASHLTGPHVEIPAILEDKMAVETSADVTAYFARLRGYANVLDEVVEKMAFDRNLGVVPPDFSIRRAIDNLESSISGPAADNSLVTSFEDKITDAGIDNADELGEQATTIVDEEIYPATRRLIAALSAALPLASHEPGVGRLPNGKAFYRAMILHMTDTTLSPEEIHAIGLAEVTRIHAEMDTLLKGIGRSEGTVGERMSAMLNDPKYLYPNTPEGKAQLMADLRADLDLADAALPDWFGKLPDQDVEIRAVPSYRENSVSGAFYDAPSMDGSRPGTYWINLADTAANPSYSLQTLTYHEANPGHHLQTILGLNDALPILNTVFYSNAAGEGWGLYAEYLASEMGLYEGDPVDDIGRLQAELHRAVRLVVDTGMHAMGWSRERAIEYSVATEGIHLSEATGEIERYAVWPGQALGYKLGMLKILELRKRAQEQLGDRFDIRAFHDRVLEEGALPLNLLEAKIDGWIQTQRQ